MRLCAAVVLLLAAAGCCEASLPDFRRVPTATAVLSSAGHNVTQLKGGQTQAATVYPDRWLYYAFTFSTTNFTNAVLTTQSQTSTLSMYGALGTAVSIPGTTAGSYDFSSEMYFPGDMSFYITPQSSAYQAHCAGKAQCVLTVAITNTDNVVNDRPNHFEVSAFTPSDHIVITPNVPYWDLLSTGSQQCYSFTRTSSQHDLQIDLTAYSGDPDLYVAHYFGTHCASRYSYEYKSTSLGTDVITIPKQDCITPPCRYSLSVQAFGPQPTVFTLLVRNATDPLPLPDGEPVTGAAERNHYVDYTWQMAKTFNHTYLAMTPLAGDPDLYVSLSGMAPTPDHYDYAALSQVGTDVLDINRADSKFRLHCLNADPCDIHIRVYGFTNCTFRLTAAHESTVVQLQQGVPVPGVAHAGEYQQYVFDYYATTGATPAPLRIGVTAQSGDPDLFVNTKPFPTAHNSNWSSIVTGSVSVTINPTDAAAAACGNPCRYYIAVRGFMSAAHYTIVADVETPHDVTHLINGYGEYDSVAPYQLKYYEFDTGPYRSPPVGLEIYGIPGSHGISLYATDKVDATGQPVFPTLSCTTPSNCSVSHAEYTPHHHHQFGAYQHLLLSEWQYSHNSRMIIAIAPNPLDVRSTFVVGAVTGDYVTVLNDGLPTYGIVPPLHQRYYVLYVTEPNKNVLVSLAAFVGTAHLYASMDTPRPNALNTTWQHSATVAEYVMIVPWYQFSDRCRQSLLAGASCPLYITVEGHGFSTYNTSYLITASTSDTPTLPQHLVNGVTMTSYVNTSQMQYFEADISGLDHRHDVFVTVSSLYGDADLYVNVNKSTFPTRSVGGFDYASASGLGVDQVVLRPDDPLFCTSCSLKIAVFGYSASLFNIQFATTSSLLTLMDNTPQFGYGQSESYTYWQYRTLYDNVDLTFVVSSGTADLVVAVYDPAHPTHLPTLDHSTWNATNTGDGASVTISHTDPHFRAPAAYVIGVFTRTNSFYSITGSLQTAVRILTLFTNQPQDDVLPAPSSAEPLPCTYFKYTWGAAGSIAPPIRVSVRPRTGSVNVYATLAYDGRTATLPNPSNPSSCLREATGNQYGKSMVLDPSSLGPCFNNMNSTWLFGVCLPSSQTYGSSYSILVSHAYAPKLLEPSLPSAPVSLDFNETAAYYFQVDDITQPVIVSVTAENGDPDIIASFTDHEPNCVFTDRLRCTPGAFLAQNLGDDSITIQPRDLPNSPGAVLYIGVYAVRPTTFTVLARQGDPNIPRPTLLLDGLPQVATTQNVEICSHRNTESALCTSTDTAHDHGAYFSFTLPANQPRGDAFVMVNKRCNSNVTSNCNPDLSIYVGSCTPNGCRPDNMYPSRLRSDIATSVSDYSGAVHIDQDTISSCYASTYISCTFYIGVFTSCHGLGCGNANFTITYSSSTGTDIVPQSCLDSGSLCQLPESSYPPNAAAERTYELHVGPGHVITTLFAQACTGSPAIAMCYGNGQSRCANPKLPSIISGNYDKYSPEDTQAGIAVLNFTTSGIAYATVMESGPNSVASSFTFSAAKSILPVLTNWRSKTVVTAASGAMATISWSKAMAHYTGSKSSFEVVKDDSGGYSIPPPSGDPTPLVGEEYFIYVVPKSLVSSSEHMETACGAEHSFIAAKSKVTRNAPQPLYFNASYPATSMTLHGLDPGTQYLVSVVAVCNSPSCGPSTVQGQSAGSPPIVLTAGANPTPTPTPAPTPTPTPTPTHSKTPTPTPTPTHTKTPPTHTKTPSATRTPSPSPSHAAGDNHHKKPGLSGGAAAGISIAVIVVVAAAAGGGFWWFRRRRTKPAVYDGAFYPSTSAEADYAPL